MKPSVRLGVSVMAAVAALSVGGCGGVYTQIERQGDGSYVLVRNRGGLFGSTATVLRCAAAEGAPDLRCVEIDSPR